MAEIFASREARLSLYRVASLNHKMMGEREGRHRLHGARVTIREQGRSTESGLQDVPLEDGC